MSDMEQRIQKLEAEVVALRNTANTAVLFAASAYELANSLAATHQNPAALLDIFMQLSSTLDAHITYSSASDEQLKARDDLREKMLVMLRAGVDPQG